MPRVWDLDTWMVFFWKNAPRVGEASDALLESIVGDFDSWVARRPRRDGQPFFVGPGGLVDTRLNAYFDSARRRRLSAAANRRAAYSLKLWLEHLRGTGSTWDRASEDDVERFAESRRYDPSSARLVQGNTWHGDVAQLLTFYKWAQAIFGVDVPVATSTRYVDGRAVVTADVATHSNRQNDVKWLSPAAVERWRDIGILGVSPEGVEAVAWRPRCEERDVAYFEGLYRTGLRMQEWSSVLRVELPGDDDDRWFHTLALADACAKGRYGHRFWIDRSAVNHVRAYVEGERAGAVARARARGGYERVRDKVVVDDVNDRTAAGTRLRLRFPDGQTAWRPVNDIPPDLRLRLFVQTPEGVEPAMLWLNENGLPRPKRAWFKTVAQINARVQKAGVKNLVCTQHMLRHSFALRWYTVGKLIRERRLAHLTEAEAQDFRAEFGSTWHLVQTMLGHRNTETTKQIYLAPFIALDIEILFEHALDDGSVRRLLESTFESHPSVVTVGVSGS